MKYSGPVPGKSLQRDRFCYKCTYMKKRVFDRSGKFWVYIVECKDGTYYTGYTNNLEKRLKEHNNGKRGAWYTSFKRPVEVVWNKEYKYKHYAMAAEYKIKQLTRMQKEMLVSGMRLDRVLEEARSYAKRKCPAAKRTG